jgi:hypothetical protein
VLKPLKPLKPVSAIHQSAATQVKHSIEYLPVKKYFTLLHVITRPADRAGALSESKQTSVRLKFGDPACPLGYYAPTFEIYLGGHKR